MKRQTLTEEKKFLWIPETPEEHELVFHARQREKISFGVIMLLGGLAFGFVCGVGSVLSVLL